MAKQKRTIADIIATAKPRTATVTLYLAGDVASRIEVLEAQLSDHAGWVADSMAAVDPRRAIVVEIRALQGQIRDSAAEFTLQAVSDAEWSALLLKHPGRQAEEGFNPETLLPALIPACCVEPAMSADDYEALSQVINKGQRDLLEAAAWRVNNEATTVPFSLAVSAIDASRTAAK
ncbi:hypothetical protein OHV05_24435 [Kitasatospora sp. NBC_00070]|uniref:hypothetical protein n=1 Tax=Kitasatospora sp. NBC_00070 TaxID=2975962 RepID=UPI00324C0D33